MVVLTDQYDRQLLERGHVERLKELGLVGGTVATDVEGGQLYNFIILRAPGKNDNKGPLN